MMVEKQRIWSKIWRPRITTSKRTWSTSWASPRTAFFGADETFTMLFDGILQRYSNTAHDILHSAVQYSILQYTVFWCLGNFWFVEKSKIGTLLICNRFWSKKSKKTLHLEYESLHCLFSHEKITVDVFSPRSDPLLPGLFQVLSTFLYGFALGPLFPGALLVAEAEAGGSDDKDGVSIRIWWDFTMDNGNSWDFHWN